MIAEARNPEGRLVQLDKSAWDHVVEQHVEMGEHLAATMATIKAPEHREPDPCVGRERYFGRGGPLRWIRVITEFHGERDRVVTAFPQSNDPYTVGWKR